MQSTFCSRKVNTAVDICRNNLVKCIKCDVPCSEGYGPGNLVTNNVMERNKGFLAERFIKPPVNLTLEFKSEIDIEYVAITCCVGSQKSKGLEVFSGLKGCYYESVASGVLPDDKIGIVFHRFNVNVKERFGGNYSFRTFKSSCFLSLVNSIKIKIFCTSKASIPALSKIEIWGTPLKSVPISHDRKNTLQSHNLSSIGPEELIVTGCAISCKSSESTKILEHSHLLSVIKKTEHDQMFTIPEDFIDPITCEVMIQPIILPSGKVIDSSTLKSHEKAELRWGRGPNDPFTGIPFSDSNKPIAASDLKSRIDKFLTDNCNVSELQNMPRTLGTISSFHLPHKKNCEVVVSKLVTNTNLKFPCKNFPTDRDISNTRDQFKFVGQTALKRKHAQIDSNKCSTFEIDNSRYHLLTSSTSSVNHLEVGLQKNLCYAEEVHDTFQERMERSLELALQATLSKLPKLTCDKTVSVEEATTALCYDCKSIGNLFSIPCNHFVCRLCLLQFKRDKIPTICAFCKCEYKAIDVQKVHTR